MVLIVKPLIFQQPDNKLLLSEKTYINLTMQLDFHLYSVLHYSPKINYEQV